MRLLPLDAIVPADAPRVGGKAFSCARLRQAGLAVPDGVVIPVDANDAALDGPDLRAWLADLPAGARLAVRSSGVDEDSAGHSFAGVHETVLDVAPADVPAAARACRASAASATAAAYRRARGLPAEAGPIAVLVQRMVVPALTSGVAFTVNPVTGATDELLVDAVAGLGEALVGGRVDPDEWRLDRTGAVRAARVAGAAPVLSEARLRELAGVLVEIERLSGAPQDVEWCHDGARLWIVQARPVTPAGGARVDTEWTRANLREVFPDLPSPMAAAWVRDSLNAAWRALYGRMLAPEAAVGPVTAVFFGRLYFNVDQLRSLCRHAGFAPAAVLRSMGHPAAIVPADEVVGLPLLARLRVAPDLARIAGRQLTVARRVRAQLARIEAEARRLEAEALDRLDDQALWAVLPGGVAQIVEDLQLVLLLGGTLSQIEAILRGLCARVGMPYERLVHPWVAAGEKSVSAAQGFDLLRVARIARAEGGMEGAAFRAAFAAFLARYGHRGRYESDPALPRYREEPAPLLHAIRLHVEAPDCPDPDAIMREQDAEAARAWAELRRRLGRGPRRLLAGPIHWLLGRTKQLYLWRERLRSEMTRLGAAYRARHLTLSRRLAARGWLDAADDYFLLTLDEIGAAIDDPAAGSSLRAIVARRKAERAGWAALDMPLLVRESQLGALARGAGGPPETPPADDTLTGLCVSPGRAEGEVVVLRDPAEFARMRRGAILVATATDPAWTPLFTLAAGVVVEVGGTLSHAATVAREYGLPALANVRHATRLLRDGDRVELDATGGWVRRLRE